MIETELYDGEYFIQKIKVDGLTAKNPATEQSFGGEYSKEAKDLLGKRRAEISIWKRLSVRWCAGCMDWPHVRAG